MVNYENVKCDQAVVNHILKLKLKKKFSTFFQNLENVKS